MLALVAGLKSDHSLMSLPVQSEICNQYVTETALERPLLYSSSLNPVESSQPMTILTMFFLKRSSAISSAPCTFIFPKLLHLLSKIQFFSINWWSPYLNHDLKCLFIATYSTVHGLFGKIKQALEKPMWYIQIELIFLYSFKTISSFIFSFLLKSVIPSSFDL